MYKLGALPNPPDPRDWVATPRPVALPREAIKPCIYKNDDQEQSNCVMQAIRTPYREYYGDPFGVSFGYGYYRDHDGPGMVPRVAYDGVREHGLPKLPDDPREYEVREVIDYARANAERLLSASKGSNGWTFYALTTKQAVQSALADSLAMPGMRVTATLRIETYEKGKNGFWRCKEAAFGLHRVMLLGYGTHEGLDGVKIRNSWGEWGDAWVTWDDLMLGGDIVLHVPPLALQTEHTVLRRTLRLKEPYMRDGNGYSDVTEAQNKLTKHGYPVGKADGIFGGRSDAATRQFQSAKGLVSDGVIGPKTWAELDKKPATPDPGPAPTPTDRAKGLIRFCQDHIGDVYCWGGAGQEVSEQFIRNHETSEDNMARALVFHRAQLLKGVTDMRLFDCSGLISKYLMDEGIIPRKKDTDGLMAMCRKITKRDLIPGDLVFRVKDSDYYHVGVYIGKGRVIEAKGRDDGVVCRGIDASGKLYWNAFGRLGI